jgi:hypothetical protein
VHTYRQGHYRRGHIVANLVLAEVHLRAGEPQGLTLAQEALTTVSTLHSLAVRRDLVAPLATALAARPDTDAQELARKARQLATTQTKQYLITVMRTSTPSSTPSPCRPPRVDQPPTCGGNRRLRLRAASLTTGRESREFSQSEGPGSGTQGLVVVRCGVRPVGSPQYGVSHSSGVCRSWRAVVA